MEVESGMNNHKFYAHSKEGTDNQEDWHLLEDHLESTAVRAKLFAENFSAGEWAYMAGLWHDLGKYSQAYQAYLLEENGFEAHIESEKVPGRVDHSTVGAKHAVSVFPILGHILAYQIAGHHCGLQDGRSEYSCLESRLKKDIKMPEPVADSILKKRMPELPDFIKCAFGEKKAFTISFFIRMLFSCLVDADFLDTECFMNQNQSRMRPAYPLNVLELMERSIDRYAQNFSLDAAPVNVERANIRRFCLEKAGEVPGFFSLTVPTGGGKTLSSLSFALKHARAHGLNRIIYVVPFTSIIEQNAEEFRKALAGVSEMPVDRMVLEHHSNFDPRKETPYSRLASENWDAPLIVTTSVQFYESLFAHRTSACRKLHRLAKAVIIIDEAQTIPVDYLNPCLKVLKQLVENYGSTVMLCTATQPAIHRSSDFQIGIDHVREIIPDPASLYKRLKRVDIQYVGSLKDDELIKLLEEEEQMLCIVNTVGHAQEISKLLGEKEGNYHLTAVKCPEHRAATLSSVRNRLKAGQVCRVISTQLIEAGVDVDFPVVFRSMAGFDSIAQAAGRCNRNGKMKSLGRVYVFRSEHPTSEKFILDTVNCASQILEIYANDPLAPNAVEHYFKMYYWDQNARWDSKHILDAFQLAQDKDFPFLFNFANVSHDFELIQQRGRPVIIPWGQEGKSLCEKLKKLPALNREVSRFLQRYTVQVREKVWYSRVGRGIKSLFEGSLAILENPELYYSETYGLRFEDPSGEAFLA